MVIVTIKNNCVTITNPCGYCNSDASDANDAIFPLHSFCLYSDDSDDKIPLLSISPLRCMCVYVFTLPCEKIRYAPFL